MKTDVCILEILSVHCILYVIMYSLMAWLVDCPEMEEVIGNGLQSYLWWPVKLVFKWRAVYIATGDDFVHS